MWTPPPSPGGRLPQEDWSSLDARAKLAVYRHHYQASKDAAGDMARSRAEAQQKDAQIQLLRAQVNALQEQLVHSGWRRSIAEESPRATSRVSEGADDRVRARGEAHAMDTEIAALKTKVETLQGQVAYTSQPFCPADAASTVGNSSQAPPVSAYDHIKRCDST